ncbi:Uncharacterised protein [BD1-7 clade bacterium]|uniref:Uncharacterized protein n=1 Tax=BD1-7 clade bacterium TaxID=2029982 RepID=A0A5S9QRY0_9GAMM|nr:Uncharacterised protein [BD1-7 clade bacterium]CAA0122683.1 Uncharacterised protein [BD1-7 clade bacterium]
MLDTKPNFLHNIGFSSPTRHMQDLPILYSFRRCPYAMRARLALFSSGEPFELREIVLRNKPEPMLLASPKGTVPVLIDNTRVVDESLDIMLWALTKNDTDNWLPQDDSIEKDTAMLWINECDNEFKPKLDRYKYFDRHEKDQQTYREESLGFINKLNSALVTSPWLLGNSPTIADMAILPFIRQYANVDATWFENSEFSHVKRWLGEFLESEIFQRIMPKYPLWTEESLPLIVNECSS